DFGSMIEEAAKIPPLRELGRIGRGPEMCEAAFIPVRRPCRGRTAVRATQAAARPISAPQCLHLVAAGFRSSDRHAGQVLVGGGAPNTVLPRRAMIIL